MSRSDSEINKTLCNTRRVFRLCHFIWLRKWARKTSEWDLRGFPFYAFTYDKQYWLYHSYWELLLRAWILGAQCVCVAQSDLSSGQSFLTPFLPAFSILLVPLHVFLCFQSWGCPCSTFASTASCPVPLYPAEELGATSCVCLQNVIAASRENLTWCCGILHWFVFKRVVSVTLGEW